MLNIQIYTHILWLSIYCFAIYNSKDMLKLRSLVWFLSWYIHFVWILMLLDNSTPSFINLFFTLNLANQGNLLEEKEMRFWWLPILVQRYKTMFIESEWFRWSFLIFKMFKETQIRGTSGLIKESLDCWLNSLKLWQ